MRRANAAAILPRYQSLSAADVTSKAVDDVVTIADAEAEAILTEGLLALIPGAKVVGEEAAFADPTLLGGIASGTTWIVDPLDGTNNFTAGKPPFGVMIALVEGGETRAGWIMDCLNGRLCHAGLGAGAFIDGERLAARTSGAPSPVAAISLVFMDPARREAMRQAVMPHYRTVDIPRCAAEQYPRLVLGENDVSIFERVLPWDHAAGALFVNEAGGRVARPDGRAYRPDQSEKGLIGAASPALWDDLAARLSGL
ncbi:inositol monophosphatase family protein [Parablastomonas sp. CN1-191]|uniref:inositol monophosphatase family protein n=1 Tax=Parablastomonas sp. CN1-191 TaxID=3400908 RepID=UPI003BF7B8C3